MLRSPGTAAIFATSIAALLEVFANCLHWFFCLDHTMVIYSLSYMLDQSLLHSFLPPTAHCTIGVLIFGAWTGSFQWQLDWLELLGLLVILVWLITPLIVAYKLGLYVPMPSGGFF